MRIAIFSFALLLTTQWVLGQKENFSLVSYSPVKGWKKQATREYVSFSTTNESKGTFCSITLYTAVEGTMDGRSNFDQSWQKTVKESLGGGEPTMESPSTENGWELQSGTGSFNASGISGSVMLITATSNGQMINLVAMLNSDVYAQQLSDFIASIELKQAPAIGNTGKQTNGFSGSIVGIWKDNILETSGYMNNMPMYTAGYFRKEYTFKSNGTYTFLRKTWSVSMRVIVFAWETGTYSVSGNQLTITPQKGKLEEWNKAPGGSTKGWGSRISSKNRSLKKTIYRFQIEYFAGSQSYSLHLFHNGETDREQSGDNSGKSSYSDGKESSIDLPPGLSISAATNQNTIPAELGTKTAMAINAMAWKD